ncbi:hypothetical protein [Roseivirga misakiensis]|uniref:Uncharacterized protein n=1 Tax=Roseivirga misakiensis TaxID=1563681 RepID=A0A1E5T607_9BACT|nr:hypothetical protein [Roseivirga misakiensis]OEK06809.1 hypothetical protein BFP71_03890 [Roseivirga misakiensis]
MRYKLKNHAVIEISKLIAADIIDHAYQSHSKMDGERLISLTNSRQVNSFIIRSLFNQWRNEVERLESPYFDFNHERVKEALKSFMNVLSNHISIDKEHLEPLLTQAIEDAILISFEPKDYLESILNRIERPQDFKLQFKYIKTNRELFKSLTDRIGDFDTKSSILQAYETIENGETEVVDVPEFLDKLNAANRISDLFDSIEEVVEVPIVEEPAPQPQPIEEELPSEKVADGPVTINDQFDQPTKGMTLAEKLQRKVNKSIESSLTLNEKFMFQNNLFDGDNSKMKEAFTSIDQAIDLQDALNRANQYNTDWDMDSEEVEAFMSVLERRFA